MPTVLGNMEVIPGGAQIQRVQHRLIDEEIEQRSDVSLDDEEEDFLEGNVVECRTDNHMLGIGPDSRADQVRVPGDCRDDGNLQREREEHVSLSSTSFSGGDR